LFDIIKGANITNEKVMIGPKTEKKSTGQEEDPQKYAQAKSEEIISAAQKKAKQLIEEANSKLEEIKKQAQNAGYSRGVEEAKAEWESKISRLKEIVKLIEKRIDLSIDELKPSLVDLSIAVVKEVAFSEVDRGNISDKINRAIDMVKSSKKIVLKISNNVPQEIVNELSKIEKVQVITDTLLDVMDVQVEADFGSLDLRINSQIALFENLIRKAFGTAT